MKVGQNVDEKEIAKFESMANFWWDTKGKLRSLHDINPLRLQYIESSVRIGQKRIVDIGCGGGILSEAMAKRGAYVTGIDMAKGPLLIACRHAEKRGLSIEYIQSSAEAFSGNNREQFDIVTCMELLEHVDEPQSVVHACADLVRPGGDVFFATIDKNLIAGILAIAGGEYILRLLAKGTHQYSRFIKNTDLRRWAINSGLEHINLTWMQYNPMKKTYRLSRKGIVNYLMHFKKRMNSAVCPVDNNTL